MQDKKPEVYVSEDSNLVTVTTPEYVKESIKEAIAEHAASRNHPYATQVEPGFVTLSNETDSDSEITAATSKAVKKAYDLANTANQNAFNNNSDLYLEKKQNGADIPDKAEFVNNIGLRNTVNQALNAVPNSRSINGKSLATDIHLMAKDVTAVSANALGGVNSSAPFQHFLSTGFAVVNIPQADKVPDFPIGLYSFGILEVQGDYSVVTQRYTSHIGEIAIRQSWDEGRSWHGWYTIRGTANTYATSSSIIKKKSSTILIYSDGTSTTSDKFEGVTTERISKGVYLIKGTSGFNTDGIQSDTDSDIEIPLSKNKLPLIWIDHNILPDDSIKLMTYHREHSDAPAFAKNIREGYSDGDLIDIPDSRFISVRVQMPTSKDEASQA
ncbi:tail fiber protein [Xenorhabdus hominickii]|uniref:Tail protein n=1 Tax=Xenorhabdus hominickii TaxID=351679 RepID=A0A2G0PZZ3_XENHO|nr:phage tail protein [Xenorhabdus hominickii]PHM52537.1 tail protein [Xenorhabdus hominickii]